MHCRQLPSVGLACMGRQLPSVGLPCSALQAHAIDEAGETGRTTVPRNRTEPDRVGRIPPTRAWRGPLGLAAEAAYGLYGLKSTRQAACQVLTSESLGRVVPERPSSIWPHRGRPPLARPGSRPTGNAAALPCSTVTATAARSPGRRAP